MFIVSRGTRKPVKTSPKKEEVKPDKNIEIEAEFEEKVDVTNNKEGK